MTKNSLSQRKRGFTFVELIMSVSIIGILAGITIPLMKVYRMKAEYHNLQTTLRYLMDGEDIYFLETRTFYPKNWWTTVNIDVGEEKAIRELNYTFPSGHKHRFVIRGSNWSWGGTKYNSFKITVYADFDRDGNGLDDRYIAETILINGVPKESGGVTYNRRFLQLW